MGQTQPGQTRGCILLFGMPRSGTTWLGKLFDSHPDTLYRHEPDTWRFLSMPRYPTPEDGKQYADLLRSFVSELPDINASRVAGKLPFFPKAYLSLPRAKVIEGGIWLARVGGQVGHDLPIFMHSSAANYPQCRVVWKSIESLGRMNAVLNALPNARGVHIIRHPCGYIASILRGQKGRKFAEGNEGGVDYGVFKATIGTSLADQYDLSLTAIEQMTPVERLSWRWVLTNAKAIQESRATGRMLVLRYEDLCHEPMARVEEMFSFTGLQVTVQTRAFVEASTSKAKGGYYSVFRDPVASASRWRQELSTETVERVMAIVRQSPLASYYDADTKAPGEVP